MENEMPRMGKYRTSMSVSEMRDILGLGKTESYWLVNKKRFETVIAGGKMRVMIASFEEWYAGQFHYKKVDGQSPGAKWQGLFLSVLETASLLGISGASLYDLLKKKPFKIEKIDNRIMIDMNSFESWYANQTHYKKVDEHTGGTKNGVNNQTKK